MLQKHKARHILELNPEEREEFLKSFDIVLSDCDGVIWLMTGPIAKAGTAINLIMNAGKKYKLISNNSMRSDAEYLDKLKEMGVDNISADDIVHPTKSITKYLQKYKNGQAVYSLGCQVFNDYLTKSGIEVETLERQDTWSWEDIQEKCTEPKTKVGAVIFDLSLDLTYPALVLAQQHLKNEGTDFIVGATDAHVPLTKDLVVPGPIGFIRLLADYTGKDPIVLGKPGTLLGKLLKEHFEIKDPKRAIFFGDALVQDIQFGNSCGFQTLLMLSGAATKEQMLALPEELKPDYYADSIRDFIKLLQK